MRVRYLSILLFIAISCFAAISVTASSFIAVSQPWPVGDEGDFGTGTFIFSVTRTGDLIGQCRVIYETRDVTALSPEDFTAVSGTVTFAPGQTSLQIPVSVKGELFHESNETFTLALVSAAGDCSLQSALGFATITNDEDPPPAGACPVGIEGDANLDAAVRVNDLVTLRRAVLGLEPEAVLGCAFQKLDISADCGDGLITAGDVTIMRQWILAGPGQRPACGSLGPPA
jgi:Calx-beta domain